MEAIPTHYRGITFRSRFEADVALWLDGLNLGWEYEPTSYLLDCGVHYMPDFWIDKLKLFVESRGYASQEGMRQLVGFGQWIWEGKIDARMKWREGVPEGPEDYADYLVIGPDSVRFVEAKTRAGTGLCGRVFLVRCRECASWFFYGVDGSQQCRACGTASGHHGAKHALTFKDGGLRIDGVSSRDWSLLRKEEDP